MIGQDNRVVGVGYNGSPPGMTHCIDGGCPRASANVAHGSSYDAPEGFCIAQHAEAGALLYSDPTRRRGGTLIVNGPPCFECARLIASSGIECVVHLIDDDYDWWPVRDFLVAAKVSVIPIHKNKLDVSKEDRLVAENESLKRQITDLAVKLAIRDG